MNFKKIIVATLCITSIASISFAEENVINESSTNINIQNSDIVYDAEGKAVDKELLQNDLVSKFYCDGDYSKCIVDTKTDGTYNITNIQREITYNVTKDCVETIEIDYNFAVNSTQNSEKNKTQETNDSTIDYLNTNTYREQIKNIGIESQTKRRIVRSYVQKAIEHNKEKYDNLPDNWLTMSKEQKDQVAKDYIAIAGLSLKPNQLSEVKDQFADFGVKEISELEISLFDLILRYKFGMNKQSCLFNQ